MTTKPTLAQAANVLTAILGVIVQMSDDVEKAASPLDRQAKLLRLQKSIQKNADRLTPHVQAVVDALKAEQDKTAA